MSQNQRDIAGAGIAPAGKNAFADTSALAEAIQRVCQTTNPVGQLAEYLVDDIESMKKFMENCKAEYVLI